MIHPFCGELRESPGAVCPAMGAGQICSDLGVLCLIRSATAEASHELGHILVCFLSFHQENISKLIFLMEFIHGV